MSHLCSRKIVFEMFAPFAFLVFPYLVRPPSTAMTDILEVLA